MNAHPVSNHLSSQFDNDLNHLAERIMTMGGAVEAQLSAATALLSAREPAASLAAQEQAEKEINAMERDVDAQSAYLIARRQPAAQDLRFVLSMLKVCNNLERMGDESIKIIRQSRSMGDWVAQHPTTGSAIYSSVLAALGMSQQMTHAALDALARLSVTDAKAVLFSDAALDAAYRDLIAQIVAAVQTAPSMAAAIVDVLFLVKAIERIGDHAKNIAECVVYIAQGEDIRHAQLS